MPIQGTGRRRAVREREHDAADPSYRNGDDRSTATTTSRNREGRVAATSSRTPSSTPSRRPKGATSSRTRRPVAPRREPRARATSSSPTVAPPRPEKLSEDPDERDYFDSTPGLGDELRDDHANDGGDETDEDETDGDTSHEGRYD
ncbi:hypothetical protein U9M48_000081 [Paspalum notatum var. saurae]|uniref:Uncharacterized protein n=1 Tax=Paspalum notatum var. saurae TaxID=547442 RepID=A0AAQ3SED5_PASNO